MDLALRKVGHPQAPNNYRVILKIDETEYEVGSIGMQVFTSTDVAWTWGIDTVVPMRTLQTEGRGRDLKDCMRMFKAAWERFASDPAGLTEFLEAKRRTKRSPATFRQPG